MSGYTTATYQINTSYISDSKGNCVNIKLIIIEGQLFSIPKHPGQTCSRSQGHGIEQILYNSDCSRKARTSLFQMEMIINKVKFKTNFQFCIFVGGKIPWSYSQTFQHPVLYSCLSSKVVNFAVQPKRFSAYRPMLCSQGHSLPQRVHSDLAS